MVADALLVLASASPRRRQLLSVFEVPFEVRVPAVVEAPLPDESPDAYARRTAGEKGWDVAGTVSGPVVVSADTVVSVEGTVLGKPRTQDGAVEMLGILAGRVHSVFTAITMIDTRSWRALTEVDETRVWFRTLDPDEIRRYVRSENVMDKAGAYAIQGGAADFIPRIEGNYSNVVGLPLPLIFDLLVKFRVLPVR